MRALMLLLSLFWGALGQAQEVALLLYQVEERGAPPYLSRFFIGKDRVRMDEGSDDPNAPYTVFDRRSQTFYNVDPQERTITLLQPEPVALEKPEHLQLEQNSRLDPQAPSIDGQPVLYVELWANGARCRQLWVAQALMPEAIIALRELHQALGRLQQRSLGIPGIDLSPCEQAEWIYAPTRALAHGLPVSDLMEGKRQVLLEYRPHMEVPEQWLAIPEHYQKTTPPPLIP